MYLLAGLALFAAPPALAQADDLTAYARARAAEADGASDIAAAGYAAALAKAPDDAIVAMRAYRQGLAVGDWALVDRAEKVVAKSGDGPIDTAIVRFAIALRAGDIAGANAALGRLEKGPLDFMVPVLGAWMALDRGDDPFPILDKSGTNPLARRYRAENRVMLLVALRRTDEALAELRPLLQGGGGNDDLRINVAMLLGQTGGREVAELILGGPRPEMAGLRARLGKGPKPGAAVGAARLFLSLAADLMQDDAPMPIAILLTRTALLLDPSDDRARLFLGEALSRAGMNKLALDTLGQVGRDSPFTRGAAAGRIAALRRAGRTGEAIALAKAQAEDRESTSADASAYGDLLAADSQFAAAASAYKVALGRPGGDADWTLHFRRGNALDRAGRWDEALPALRRAAGIAPLEAQALSTLGVALIAHHQDLDEAQALLERASGLRPADAGITDSLAWAYYTRGDVARALPLLERAATADPGGSLVNEHLGDAYWKLGRRYEARYAWRAAAIYADAGAGTRIAAKLANGLTASN
ncbi:MAG: tetratricopeptide repeat protein [Pseudomonadota bacterium]